MCAAGCVISATLTTFGHIYNAGELESQNSESISFSVYLTFLLVFAFIPAYSRSIPRTTCLCLSFFACLTPSYFLQNVR